jgi:hypothetical protein
MVEIIASDFGVEIVVKNKSMSFLAAPKNVFFHFVFFQKKDGYNEIKQFYVHRFEIMNWLYNVLEKDGDKNLFLKSNGITLALEYQLDLNRKDLNENPIILITYGDDTVYFPLNENTFGEQLLKDLTILKKVHIESTKKPFNKKIITAILGEYDESQIYPFSINQLSIAAFELKISKTKKSWQRTSDYYELVNYQYRDAKEIDSYMADNICNTLHMVVGKTDCYCGSEGCFFDLLYKAYTTFFTEEDLLTDGSLDEEKVTAELNTIWKKLDAKQRAVMNYLDDQFGNTPLINLYLLTENADFEEYIFKMTYQEQPDSEEDSFVRKLVSLVRFYLN